MRVPTGFEGNTIITFHSRGLGAPIVFLHGDSTSSGLYDKQLNGKLGRTHQVICIDFPGHGESSKALSPEKTYGTQGLTSVVLHVVEKFGLHDAVFVGAGLGASVLTHAAANLPRARGFLLVGSDPASLADRALASSVSMTGQSTDIASAEVMGQVAASFVRGAAAAPAWLAKALLESDPRNREQLRKDREAGTAAGDVAAINATVGLIRGDGDNCQFATPKALWRDAVQVVPGAAHLIPDAQSASFDRMVRSFVADLNRTAAPELVDETFGVCSGIAATQAPKAKGVLRKEIVGSSNIRARYEPQHEDEAPNYRHAAPLSHAAALARGSGRARSSAARGRCGVLGRGGGRGHPRGGAAPGNGGTPRAHPITLDRLGMHLRAARCRSYETGNNQNPNARGRKSPGTMPHRNSRFEGFVEPEPEPVVGNDTVTVGTHPNFKGRVHPGTMPHKNARFELPSEDLQHAVQAPDNREDSLNNPNARGRRVPGTMPHASARFDYAPVSSPAGLEWLSTLVTAVRKGRFGRKRGGGGVVSGAGWRNGVGWGAIAVVVLVPPHAACYRTPTCSAAPRSCLRRASPAARLPARGCCALHPQVEDEAEVDIEDPLAENNPHARGTCSVRRDCATRSMVQFRAPSGLGSRAVERVQALQAKCL